MTFSRKTLEDVRSNVDAGARDLLTHTIRYKTGSGPWTDIQVQADYETGTINLGTSVGVSQEITMMMLRADHPARPHSGDRIITSRKPGEIFGPVNPRADETGMHWLFELKAVAS
jgi:hypothetical protein